MGSKENTQIPCQIQKQLPAVSESQEYKHFLKYNAFLREQDATS